jgi:hypothetical protein
VCQERASVAQRFSSRRPIEFGQIYDSACAGESVGNDRFTPLAEFEGNNEWWPRETAPPPSFPSRLGVRPLIRPRFVARRARHMRRPHASSLPCLSLRVSVPRWEATYPASPRTIRQRLRQARPSACPSTIRPTTIANVSGTAREKSPRPLPCGVEFALRPSDHPQRLWDLRSEIAADPFRDFPKEKISDCGG